MMRKRSAAKWELYAQVLQTLDKLGGTARRSVLAAQVLEDVGSDDLKRTRVYSARLGLKKAGLLDYDWDQTKITDLGRQRSKDGPLDLRQFVLHRNFQSEGERRRRKREHSEIERNPKIVRDKKEDVLKNGGALVCEVCAIDFAQVYGKLGEGFVECHHKVPISTLDKEIETQFGDLALVCANCHRMLHRAGGRTLEELQSIVQHMGKSS